MVELNIMLSRITLCNVCIVPPTILTAMNHTVPLCNVLLKYRCCSVYVYHTSISDRRTVIQYVLLVCTLSIL